MIFCSLDCINLTAAWQKGRFCERIRFCSFSLGNDLSESSRLWGKNYLEPGELEGTWGVFQNKRLSETVCRWENVQIKTAVSQNDGSFLLHRLRVIKRCKS